MSGEDPGMAETRHSTGRGHLLLKGVGIPALVGGVAIALWAGFRSLPFSLGPPLEHLVLIDHGREVKAGQVEALIRRTGRGAGSGFP